MLARINVAVTLTKTALLRPSLGAIRDMEAPAHVGGVSSASGQEEYRWSTRCRCGKRLSTQDWVAFCGYMMLRGKLLSNRQRGCHFTCASTTAHGGRAPSLVNDIFQRNRPTSPLRLGQDALTSKENPDQLLLLRPSKKDRNTSLMILFSAGHACWLPATASIAIILRISATSHYRI
jgi:hypothetical protein